MNKEIKINKLNKSITFINNGIAFSQFGVADEILDLITNLQKENEELKKNQRLTPEQRQHFHLELDEILEIYKQRIDNAINYIDEHCIDDEFICNLSSKEKGILKVRKILGGIE